MIDDATDQFVNEMREWFLANPQRYNTQTEKIPFLNRYDPTADPEKERLRREKISATLKSQPRSANSMKNLEKNTYWKGKKQPPEMVEKRRQSMIGREVSEETRRKISEANMGSKPTMGMKGKKHSEETKEKLRQAALRRKYK